MTTQITMMDRDELLSQQRTEQEQAENEDEISRLLNQIKTARESLRISEKNLAAIQEALSGTTQHSA